MSYFKNHKTIMYVLGGLILISAIVIPRVFNTASVVDQSKEYKPLVSVLSVDKYLGNLKQVDIDATVESKDQVEIKAQISAPVQSVNVGIGDKVYAGQVLLVLKNDDIESQLNQAKARLAEVKKGTRSEEMAIYEQQYANAQRDLNNSVRDTYTKIEDSVINKTDILFTNGGTVNPTILVRTENTTISNDINMRRIILGEKLELWKNIFSNSTNISKDDEAKISSIIALSKQYFDLLANIVNDLTVGNSGIAQVTIDGYKAAVSGAQIQLNGAAMAYSATVSSWKVAGDNLSLRKAGATTEQLQTAEAALQGAQATYNKSIITSPMNGIVSTLPYRLGDLVSPGVVIAGVVNKDGLELKGYVSSDDALFVKEGDKVLIDNKYNAVISRISPSVDSKTKKVEVKIAVTDANTDLIIGNSSHVIIYSNISDDNSLASSTQATSTSMMEYTLPISAVNISNSGTFVYSIDETGTKVIAHEIKTGEVSGENIRILSGIEKGMNIVTPVIGLKDGSIVKIKN